jgi:hypothetical protein
MSTHYTDTDNAHALGGAACTHQQEVQALQLQVKRLTAALDEIVGHGDLTLMTNPDLGDDICHAYSRGANEAFAQMASIASTALADIPATEEKP